MTEWIPIIERALQVERTPLFVFSWPRVRQAVDELNQAEHSVPGLPVRHWLSFKTQPLQQVLRSWHENHGGVEVVSEFELIAARTEGFDVDRLLVNGVAKHAWLGRYSQTGLRVHFDSIDEIDGLLGPACDDR